MAFKNYKEGTGVRARGDLSANAKARVGAMSDEQLIKVADFLSGVANNGVEYTLKPELSRRLADAILECVNRTGTDEHPRPEIRG